MTNKNISGKVGKNVTLLRRDFALRGRNRTADFLMRCFPLQSDAMNQLDHPEEEELLGAALFKLMNLSCKR
jgi:hypothetical protein